MRIRTLVLAAFVFVSADAFALIQCSVNISLSAGGGGSATYTATSCLDNLNTVSNLAISITVGPTTWNQTQLTAKYPPPPYGNLFFDTSSGDCGPAFWDDPDDGSGDTAIAIFTNGPQVLTFDEGDLGTFTYSINGTPTGTYAMNILTCARPNIAVPGLSPLNLALLGLMIAALGFAAMRWRRAGSRNTSA